MQRASLFAIMKPRRIYPVRVYCLIELLIAVGLLQALGCGLLPNPTLTMKDPNNPDPDLIALETANQAVQKGQFKKAIEGFEILRHSADPKIARKAFYGLVCAYLNLAEDPVEFRRVLMLWQEWSKLAPKGLEDEDPRLLGPLLQAKMLSESNSTRKAEPPRSNEDDLDQKRLRAKEQEIQRLNDQVKVLKKEIQTLLKDHTDYMAEMEREIQALQDKIKSLQAIDQKIEEKKKEVSSP